MTAQKCRWPNTTRCLQPESYFGQAARSPPEVWANDPDYSGGYWLLVYIDLAKVCSKAVRPNISLNEALVQRIDAAAKARGQSRSAFLATAAEHEMAGA